jgi:hypothetical protein
MLRPLDPPPPPPLISILKKAGCVPELVWILWLEEKYQAGLEP